MKIRYKIDIHRETIDDKFKPTLFWPWSPREKEELIFQIFTLDSEIDIKKVMKTIVEGRANGGNK